MEFRLNMWMWGLYEWMTYYMILIELQLCLKLIKITDSNKFKFHSNLFLGFILWVRLDPLSNNCISYILIYAMYNENIKLLSF